MKINNLLFEKLTVNQSLKKLRESNDLPVKTSFSLTKLSKELEKVAEPYFSEKEKLLLKYGRKDEKETLVRSEDGRGFLIDPEKIQDYVNDLKILQDEEVEISIKEKVKIKFSDVPKGIVNSFDIEALEDIVEFTD